MSRVLLMLLAGIASSLFTMGAMAADPAAPPRGYKLDSLNIRVERLPGHGQPRVVLAIAGSGSASLESGRPTAMRNFAMASADIVGLVNGLYRMRFFDLPAVLGPRSSVLLMPDGNIGMQMAPLFDATTANVCFSLPTYEKCVRYTEGQGPSELEAWVTGVTDEAVLRAQNAPSK